MIKIQTKLVLFVVTLLVFVIAIAWMLFTNSTNSVKQYDALMNRFFLLNNIYKSTIKVNEAITSYVIWPQDNDHLEYFNEAAELRKQQELMMKNIANQDNQLLVMDYNNMINSFLDEGQLSMQEYDADRYDKYYDHLTQTGKIAQFIQESTLTLINSELTDYQDFYYYMSQKTKYLRLMGIYIFLATAVACIIYIFWFSRGITRPIQLLNAAAKQISRGNFDIKQFHVKTRDELQFLTETFYRMCRNIRSLIAEIEQKSELDQLMRKMELKSLQNQINPHFLFNTLNMVAKMAYVEGAEKTTEIVESVSALLRYNMSSLDNKVLLRDELAIVKEYFFIQKMRFGNRIEFEYNISEQDLDVYIPPLIIQPLVENAFMHGVESYEQGAEISIYVYREKGRLIVEVRDNGLGMSQERIQEILSEQEVNADLVPSSKQSSGIALRNVRRRLQLFYLHNDVIEIESMPGKGTVVRLLLTYESDQLGGVPHVQASYC